MPKLTEAIVEKLKFDPSGKETQLVWDDDLPGLAVRLYPSGRKLYTAAYRLGRGRGCPSRRVSLDDTRRMSLKDARELAAKIISNGRQGVDYLAALTRTENVLRVSDLCEQYLEVMKAKWAKNTLEQNTGIVNREIVPFMGKKPVQDVQTPDVARLIKKIGARAPVMANRTRALLSSMFSWAEREGMRPKGQHPVEDVEMFKETARRVHVSDAQLRCLHAALDDAPPLVAAAVRMILFTTGRPGEITNLRWDPDPAGQDPHLELEARRIFLPNAKSGVGVIPLNSLAVRLLKTLERRQPYVFSEKGENPYTRVRDCWPAIRAKAGLPNLHLHDLRHVSLTYSSILEANPHVAKELARHANVSTTQIYVNPSSAQAAELSERIGQHIEAILDGKITVEGVTN